MPHLLKGGTVFYLQGHSVLIEKRVENHVLGQSRLNLIPDQKTAILAGLYVEPVYRRLGVATDLYKSIKVHLLENNYEWLGGEVTSQLILDTRTGALGPPSDIFITRTGEESHEELRKLIPKYPQIDVAQTSNFPVDDTATRYSIFVFHALLPGVEYDKLKMRSLLAGF